MATKDWKKPSGAKRSYEKYRKTEFGTYVGTWLSYHYIPKEGMMRTKSEYPWKVSKTEMSITETIGRFKTKSQALSFMKEHMRSH